VDELINLELFKKDRISIFYTTFCSNQPIRHLLIDDFLKPEFATIISENFPPVEEMNVHYHGLNEKKSEHSEFNTLDLSFSQLHLALTSNSFVSWLSEITGINNLHTINDRLGYGLHQGANNSFLDIHIDYNIHPLEKKFRKLNLILFFNKEWGNAWGGHLELWDEKIKNCVQSIPPIFNRCVIFECSDISYHGYNRISVPNGITRKSYYQYYFMPINNNIVFHDTIFRTRPHESLFKKVLTPSKDFLKNLSKRILFKMGWKKFLK
jgi:Rps23 Pro-64 3,4-dihydroxylase Tpa1-like proline 4-hydroxylase